MTRNIGVYAHALTFIALALAVILRFTYLDRIPTGITGDELLYVMTAKSVAISGHDLNGSWNPLSVFAFRYPTGEQQAELPYVIHLPLAITSDFSLFSARFPFALLSIGIVLLIYLICRTLLDERTAGIASFVAAVNPWFVVMGRTGYESTPAAFFYLTGLLVLLKAKSWYSLWSIVPFVLAFYSYIGTKVLFVPFIILSCAFAYARAKHRKARPLFTLCALSIGFVILFLALLHASGSPSRLSELFTPSNPLLAPKVDQIRKNSIPTILTPLVENKLTVYGQMLTEKLFTVFSPSYLFVNGDQFFLPVRHGFFYMTEAVFLLFGILSLYAKSRRLLLFLLSFTLIGALPHIVHTTQSDFSAHIVMVFPFMIIIIAAGIAELTNRAHEVYSRAAAVVISCAYILSLIHFTSLYFLQYPLLGYSDFPMRVVSKYLALAKESGKPIRLYSNRGPDLLKKYLFYTNTLDHRTLDMIRSQTGSKLPVFDAVTFSSCENERTATGSGGTSIVDAQCDFKSPIKNLRISRLVDGGSVYEIINDPVCDPDGLQTYPQGVQIDDLLIESLSPTRFCRVYVNK